MNEVYGWVPDARFAWAVLIAWLAIVAAYALWRSRGDAPTDPIRPSGPIG